MLHDAIVHPCDRFEFGRYAKKIAAKNEAQAIIYRTPVIQQRLAQHERQPCDLIAQEHLAGSTHVAAHALWQVAQRPSIRSDEVTLLWELQAEALNRGVDKLR